MHITTHNQHLCFPCNQRHWQNKALTLTNPPLKIWIHAFISSHLDYYSFWASWVPWWTPSENTEYGRKAWQPIQELWQYHTYTLKKLHWLPVSKRITFTILLLTYKCLNDLYQPKHALRSSSKSLLDAPSARTITYGTISQWRHLFFGTHSLMW